MKNQNGSGRFASLKEKTNALKAQTLALYYAYRDPRVPWYARIWVAVVVAYAFSPIDLIPDFIPILGYLDDLVLIPLGVAVAIRMIPGEVMAECQIKAENRLAEEQPHSWVMGGIILLIWIVVIGWIIFSVWGKFSG